MRGRNLDHTVIARLERIGTIRGLANKLTFQDVYALFEGMDVRLNGPAGVELRNAELLVDGAIRSIDNAPTPIAFAQRFICFRQLEIFLVSRSDDVSGRHALSLIHFTLLCSKAVSDRRFWWGPSQGRRPCGSINCVGSLLN